MLHVLRILDNPLQDIPLFGVMRSLIGQFTDSDIACLRAICPEGTLYEALETAGGGSRERGMGEKTGPAEMNGRAGEADTEEEEEDYDTLNGFLIYKLDRIPQDGETAEITYKGYLFSVLKVENKTIQQIRVTKLEEEPEE